jgi:hypothetical protein
MDNFDLKKYLAERKLFEDENGLIHLPSIGHFIDPNDGMMYIEDGDGNPDMEEGMERWIIYVNDDYPEFEDHISPEDDKIYKEILQKELEKQK